MQRLLNTIAVFLFFCAASAVEAQESGTPTPSQGAETTIMSVKTDAWDIYQAGYTLTKTSSDEVLTDEQVESIQLYIGNTSNWIVKLRKRARHEDIPISSAAQQLMPYIELGMISLRTRVSLQLNK